MPKTQKLRRGSIGTLIVFAFAVCLLLLPLGLTGIRQACDLVLLQQAHQFMDQILPAAYTCLDPAKLAIGHPAIPVSQGAGVLRNRFDTTLPPALTGRLKLVSIQLLEQAVQPDPNHWMGDDQPSSVPVLVIIAIFYDYRGRRISLRHSIEVLLD